MKLKKSFAILLCAVFLFSAISAGCSTPDIPEINNGDDPLSASDPPVVESPPAGSIDFDLAVTAFPPDTIMFKTNNLSVTWRELFGFFFSFVSNLEMYYPTGIDWSDEIAEGVSLKDFILESSTEESLLFMIIEHAAIEMGVSLSTEDFNAINEDIDHLIAMYGTKDNFELALREDSGIFDMIFFERFLQIQHLQGLILTKLYGDDLSDLPDDADEFVNEHDFLMAKHILIAFSEHDDALEVAEEVLSLLTEHLDDEDFFEFFDTKMHEVSDDPGALSFPDGYLFQPHEMLPQFSQATIELEFGEMSGLVETVHGYHIILRLPVDFDTVPIYYANSNTPPTLRQIIISEDFESRMVRWRSELNPVFSPEYNSIDLAAIFHLS